MPDLMRYRPDSVVKYGLSGFMLSTSRSLWTSQSINPERPYLKTESRRYLIRSDSLLPYISYIQGQSVSEIFYDENVGVLKDLVVFGFRHIKSGEMNAKSVHSGYLELSKFLKELIGKQHGAWALDHLPEDLADLFALMEENMVIDQELIVDHASLLLDDERARTQFEIHKLLRKELPHEVSLKKHVSF